MLPTYHCVAFVAFAVRWLVVTVLLHHRNLTLILRPRCLRASPAVRLLQREQNQDLPPTEPTGLRGELVATQKARKSQQTLQRMQDMLRKERAAATAQAMRLAKETKFRRNMEQRLEKLQKILHGQQVSELTHSRGKRPRARGKPMATQPAPGSPANGAAAGHAVLYNDAARRLDDLLDSKRLQRIGRTSMRHSASGRRSTPGKHIEYQRPSTSHSATCRRIAAVGNGAGVPADSSRASQRPRSSAGHRRKPRSASRERRHRGRTDDRRRKRGGHYRRSQSEHYLVPIADHASALPSGLRGRFGEALEKSMAARARAAMAVKERS